MKKFIIAVYVLLSAVCLSAAQPPNFILLITDQERHHTHWPKEWVERHLPSQARLQKNGLTFNRAYTAVSMCSPARAALMTSQYYPVNQVATTLSPTSTSPTLPTKSALTNLASIIEQNSDYEVVWKGKWHLSYAADGLYNWSDQDVADVKNN